MALTKKLMIEVGGVRTDDIDVDYRRGIVGAGRTRVCEWQGDDAKMSDDNCVRAGITNAPAIRAAIMPAAQQ